MKKKKLLERIEYLEDKVLKLQATDTQIDQRIETICQIITHSDLMNPAMRKRSKVDN